MRPFIDDEGQLDLLSPVGEAHSLLHPALGVPAAADEPQNPLLVPPDAVGSVGPPLADVDRLPQLPVQAAGPQGLTEQGRVQRAPREGLL